MIDTPAAPFEGAVSTGAPGAPDPDGVSRRIRLFPSSAKKTLPAASTAMPPLPKILAEVAGPPSPRNANVPLPATVEMIPVDAVTIRIRVKSEMKRLPDASTATL